MLTSISLSTVQLNREWLLGQIRVRCCHPDNLTVYANGANGLVCAKILSKLETENEILEIMTLQDFSLSLLHSCLLYDNQGNGHLFNASKKVLLSHVKTLTETLPRPFGLFKPSCWPLSNNDSRYSEWLENTFNNGDFVRNLAYLLPSLAVAFESKKALENIEDDEEDLRALTRCSVVLAMEFCKWINCDLKDEKILQGREETTSLCFHVVALALSHKSISAFLCKDFPQR